MCVCVCVCVNKIKGYMYHFKLNLVIIIFVYLLNCCKKRYLHEDGIKNKIGILISKKQV